MPKLTIDGKEVEVAAGTNLIEAARQAGVEVPHYCYHPGLSIAGQCRLCMVDIEKNPRPQIGCNTQAADGMVVHTQTERVLETRKSIMEFHLVNHPLDCPVCDQAGECWLQIYYMRHGLYDPRMVDDKDAGDVTHITLSYTFYPVTPKPGLAEKPAKPDPATPKPVPGEGRAG